MQESFSKTSTQNFMDRTQNFWQIPLIQVPLIKWYISLKMGEQEETCFLKCP